MRRNLEPSISDDLRKRIIILTGPRQSGKTTLSRQLSPEAEYLNYDFDEHRRIIRQRSWDRRKPLLILDELHKMPIWKTLIKGIYDVEGIPPGILVTGSARLDTIRKTGDSLAGRFFGYRLHPFDIKEVRDKFEPENAFSRIMKWGGFPEPFIEASDIFYGKWRRSHLDIILRQDLLDITNVRDIRSIEVLIDLLKNSVGSPVSYASLARDLQKDEKTVKRWLEILEDLYVIFPLRPIHRNVARSILKMPKYYFYDTALITNGEAARIENLTACAIIKECHYREDTEGRSLGLNYLRSKDGREVDFAVSENGSVQQLIEVKAGNETMSASLGFFHRLFPDSMALQLVVNPKREKTFPDGSELRSLVPWLADISL